MISINNFSFTYPETDNLIVNNFYLQLQPSEKAILLGSNGVGKSSILRGIWEKSFQNKSLPVSRAYFSQDIPKNLTLNPHKISSSFYEIQHELLATDFPFIDEQNGFQWLVDALEVLSVKFKSNLQEKLFEMKLASGFMSSKYSELSPGTKKKLLLSILFATEPDFILADEITNHLDKDAVNIVINWIKNSRSAMLIVDHNREFLNSISNRYLFLPNNKERKVIDLPKMSFDEVLDYLANQQEKQKAEQMVLKKREKQIQKQMELLRFRAEVFNSDIGSAMRTAKRKLEWEVYDNPIINEFDLNKKVKFKPVINPDKTKENVLVQVDNLQYKIGQNLIQTVEKFRVYGGSKIRITGPNGRGKSTLLDFIDKTVGAPSFEIGKHPQYLAGEVRLSNFQTGEYFSLKQVTNYPQDYTVESYLIENTDMMPYNIPGFLKNLELAKFNGKSHLNHLSMGEFIRLQLGVLAKKQHLLKLIVLDEPGNFLDVFTQEALINLLKTYTGCLIIISHDEKLIEKIDIDESFNLD